MKSLEIGIFQKQSAGFTAFIPKPFPPKAGFDFEPALLKKSNDNTFANYGAAEG